MVLGISEPTPDLYEPDLPPRANSAKGVDGDAQPISRFPLSHRLLELHEFIGFACFRFRHNQSSSLSEWSSSLINGRKS